MSERFFQVPCGCWKQGTPPSKKPWYYRPALYWAGWKTLLPINLGGDEYCRYDMVVGWPITGQVVIPTRPCKGDCGGCGPAWVNSVRIYGVTDEAAQDASDLAKGKWSTFVFLLDVDEKEYAWDSE